MDKQNAILRRLIFICFLFINFVTLKSEFSYITLPRTAISKILIMYFVFSVTKQNAEGRDLQSVLRFVPCPLQSWQGIQCR